VIPVLGSAVRTKTSVDLFYGAKPLALLRSGSDSATVLRGHGEEL